MDVRMSHDLAGQLLRTLEATTEREGARESRNEPGREPTWDGPPSPRLRRLQFLLELARCVEQGLKDLRRD
jgi:hypothetical protein